MNFWVHWCLKYQPINVYCLVVWFMLSSACTCHSPNSWFFRHIYYQLQNPPVQTSENQGYFLYYLFIGNAEKAMKLNQAVKSPDWGIQINDFMTLVNSSRGLNSENIHKVIFKWETATENDILLAPVQTTLASGLRNTILLSLGNII